MTKFYLMMIIPNPWLDLDAEPSSSDGDVEGHIGPTSATLTRQPEASSLPRAGEHGAPSGEEEAGIKPGPSDPLSELIEIVGHYQSYGYRFGRTRTNKARVTPSREFIPDEEALFELIEEKPLILQEPFRNVA